MKLDWAHSTRTKRNLARNLHLPFLTVPGSILSDGGDVECNPWLVL